MIDGAMHAYRQGACQRISAAAAIFFEDSQSPRWQRRLPIPAAAGKIYQALVNLISRAHRAPAVPLRKPCSFLFPRRAS
jgi:hypothetical protein